MARAGNPDSIARHPEARSAAIFAIGAGIVIILIWLWQLTGGELPELQTEPLLTWLRLVLAAVTAALLIVAGWALLSGKHWARKFYLLAAGMLLVGAVNDIGHYIQRGDTVLPILSFLLAVFCIAFIIRAER
ncbi:MAG: hypothetical protein ABI399_06770 [Bauldia sp.]